MALLLHFAGPLAGNESLPRLSLSPAAWVDKYAPRDRRPCSAMVHGGPGGSTSNERYAMRAAGGMCRRRRHGGEAVADLCAKSQRRGSSVDPAGTSKVARNGRSRRPLCSGSLAAPVSCTGRLTSVGRFTRHGLTHAALTARSFFFFSVYVESHQTYFQGTS